MGTTSPKNLRYPEANTEGRTMPARIKDLADDANTALTAYDTRFSGLDAKIEATNNKLTGRGCVIARYGHCAGVATHLPNDGILRTVNQHTDKFWIPTAATRVVVSMMNSAFSTTNAAGAWYPLVSFTPGGVNWIGMGEFPVHNQTQPALDLGFSITAEFNVEAYSNVWCSVAVQGYCDPASGSWINCGPLRWSTTLIQ